MHEKQLARKKGERTIEGAWMSAETKKFRAELLEKLSKDRETFGVDLDNVINVCSEPNPNGNTQWNAHKTPNKPLRTCIDSRNPLVPHTKGCIALPPGVRPLTHWGLTFSPTQFCNALIAGSDLVAPTQYTHYLPRRTPLTQVTSFTRVMLYCSPTKS
ncbi:hypothetical protein LguiA_000282 [Lonicera macranthoides]